MNPLPDETDLTQSEDRYDPKGVQIYPTVSTSLSCGKRKAVPPADTAAKKGTCVIDLVKKGETAGLNRHTHTHTNTHISKSLCCRSATEAATKQDNS